MNFEIDKKELARILNYGPGILSPSRRGVFLDDPDWLTACASDPLQAQRLDEATHLLADFWTQLVSASKEIKMLSPERQSELDSLLEQSSRNIRELIEEQQQAIKILEDMQNTSEVFLDALDKMRMDMENEKEDKAGH